MHFGLINQALGGTRADIFDNADDHVVPCKRRVGDICIAQSVDNAERSAVSLIEPKRRCGARNGIIAEQFRPVGKDIRHGGFAVAKVDDPCFLRGIAS